eukprot:PLAT8027.1.p2 GENE.PLAT8027.1~~PLAT8027.1.p2  ORF type:complete len:756 (+),score=425.52 PLAT8027.1:37-2304(+)
MSGRERLVDSKEPEVTAAMQKPRVVCLEPLSVIGLQTSSPIGWSCDGQRLAFVSTSHSIFIAQADEPAEDGSPSWTVTVQRQLTGHHHEVKALLWHPTDPTTLVSAGADGIIVHDAETGEVKHRLDTLRLGDDAHEGDVECLEWAFDGTTLLSGGKDTNVKIWDSNSDFRLLETLFGHKAAVLSVRFNAATTSLVTAGRDSTIKVWDAHTLDLSFREQRADDRGVTCKLTANLDGHSGDVCTLTFNNAGTVLFSGARDNTIKVWDVALNKELRTIIGHHGDVRRMVLLNREKFLFSGALDGSLRLWELVEDVPESGEEEEKSAESALEAILGDVSVVEVAAKKDKQVIELEAFADAEEVFALEFNPKRPLLAVASALNSIRLFNVSDLARPQRVQDFVGHTGSITEVCLLSDKQRFVSASSDYLCSLYDQYTTQRHARFEFTGSVYCAAVTPDQKYLFAGGTDYSVKVFDLSDSESQYQEVGALDGHAGRVLALDICPNGKLLATGSHDFTIKLWKVRDDYFRGGTVTHQSPVASIDAHLGHVFQLKFSDELGGKFFLASASNDHSVKLWKVKKGVLGHDLKTVWEATDAHESAVSTLAWGHGETSQVIFSGGWDHTVRVFNKEPVHVVGGVVRPTAVLRGHSARLSQIECTPNGQALVSSSTDGTACLWSTADPFELLARYGMQLMDGIDHINCVSVADTMFLTGSESGMIKLWPLYGVDRYEDSFVEPEAVAAIVEEAKKKEEPVAVVTMSMD